MASLLVTGIERSDELILARAVEFGPAFPQGVEFVRIAEVGGGQFRMERWQLVRGGVGEVFEEFEIRSGDRGLQCGLIACRGLLLGLRQLGQSGRAHAIGRCAHGNGLTRELPPNQPARAHTDGHRPETRTEPDW